MASTVVNKAATRIADDLFTVSYLAGSAGIQDGCIVVRGSDDDSCALPAAALAKGILGVSKSAGPFGSGTGQTGAATSGVDRVAVQKLGRARVLVAANTTVNRGEDCVIANSSGHGRSRVPSEGTCGILGQFAQSKTTGANPEFVEVDLEIETLEQSSTVMGGSTNAAIGAATKYLASPGVAVAAAQIPLYVAPQAATIRNLRAQLGTAPGGSDTVAFTVQKSSDNGATWADTALTATISAAGKSASDVSDVVSIAAGDLLAIKVVSSGATAAFPSCSFQVV